MDLDIVELIFKIGNIFGLTPSDLSDEQFTTKSKIQSFFRFLLLVIFTVFSFSYKKQYYLLYTPIQLILKLLMDIDLLFSVFYQMIVITYFKRSKWFELARCIKSVKSQKTSKIFRFAFFALTLVGYCLVQSMLLLAWTRTLGWNYLKAYLIEYIEFFMVFYGVVTANTFLNLMVSRYRYQNELFSKLVTIPVSKDILHFNDLSRILASIKQNMFLLKEATLIFNDIFGWILLTSCIFGICLTFLFWDISINDNYNITDDFDKQLHLFSRINVIVLFWIGFLETVLLCDIILQQFEDFQKKLLKFQMMWMNSVIVNRQEMTEFINFVKNCSPTFTSAKFQNITRAAILATGDIMITFLIVIVQFKINR